jgi:Mn2+/Fe2+ NRAMP family transporter
MIPLVLLSKDKHLMGEFVNRQSTTFIAVAFVVVIVVLDLYLVATSLLQR